MSDHRIDLDELIGDVPAGERERLARVHELLLEAGPPPELSPELSEPPAPPTARIHDLRHRYRYSVIAAAAVLALTVFGLGYLVGGSGGPRAERTVAMTGQGGALGTIDVFAADSAGNWPMELSVAGLPALPEGKTYALWLTQNGKLADQCGTFAVGEGETVVPLNAPFSLKEYSGWVVVESGSSEFVLRTATV
jgi:Anti-sigma-K factor rskA